MASALRTITLSCHVIYHPWRRLQLATMQSAVEDLKDEKVPACLYWSVDQVADWIEELGFPNYRVLLHILRLITDFPKRPHLKKCIQWFSLISFFFR